MLIPTLRALLLMMFVAIVGCVGAAPDDPTDPSTDDSGTQPAADPAMPGDPGQTGTTSLTTCAGKVYGGACWYAAGNGQSCASFCAGHGGYDSKTATLAGANDSFCQHTLDLVNLMRGTGFSESDCTVQMGCFGSALQGTAGHQYRCIQGGSPNGYSLASYYTTRLACACKL